MNIIEAAQLDDLSAATGLLLGGAAVDAQDEGGRTALHWACQNGSMDFVNLLLEHGANPNVADDEGFTPLTVASSENPPLIVKRLLKAGADPNVRIEALNNGTVLHLVSSWGRYEACVELLQCNNIDLGVRDRSGMTALDFAVDAGATELWELLAKHMQPRTGK